MATPIGFFPGATPEIYRSMGQEGLAQKLEAALAAPAAGSSASYRGGSAYVPSNNAAAGGASHLAGGVQLVPNAPGYDEAAAISVLQKEIAPYDAEVRNWLQSINRYDAATQARVEAIAANDARRNELAALVNSGSISVDQAISFMQEADTKLQRELSRLGGGTVSNSGGNVVDGGGAITGGGSGGFMGGGALLEEAKNTSGETTGGEGETNGVSFGLPVYGPDGKMYSSPAAALAAGVTNFTYEKPVMPEAPDAPGLIEGADNLNKGFMRPLPTSATGDFNPGGLIQGQNPQLFSKAPKIRTPAGARNPFAV